MTALSKDRPLERAAYRASDEAWSKAVRIARELDRVLDGDLPMREAVSRAAVELRLSTRQVYNHLARYREDRRVSSLLPRTNGARRARISASVEAIISDTLRKMWLQPEQPDRECLKLCVSDLAHAVFRYGQASKRPANIMAS